MNRVVMFSGGVGSYFTAKRVIERHGREDVTLLFADVKREDKDTYRFIREATEKLAVPLVVVADGRDPWRLFFDVKFIGNGRIAKCSSLLKVKPCREWLKANCDPSETVLYVGMDWSEPDRQPGVVNGWKPYPVEFPLCEPPYLLKVQLLSALEQEEGIRRPALYEKGYPHNNCGGACVKAGQAQWAMVLRDNPDLFAYHEANEERFRRQFGKEVAILKETRNNVTRPLPLAELRRRVESNAQIDLLDFGGCGCFVEEMEDAA